MGLSPTSYNERAWRQANPQEYRKQRREQMAKKGMHPRLGWCKFGDWDGKLPAGKSAFKWNGEGANHPMLPNPKRLHVWEEYNKIHEYMTGCWESTNISTWEFRVPTPDGEAVLYMRANHATGRIGWW